MPDDKPTFHLPLAQRYILRENKVPKEEIDQIQSVEEADALIKHVTKNNAADETPEDSDNQKAIQNGMHNASGEDFQLPPPGEHHDELNLTVSDRLKSARVNNYLNNRWQHARIMRVFGDDEYPEGRVL